MPWTVHKREKREGECDPGLWITDAKGNTVVDTGAIDCWPLSEKHKAMIEALPELLDALRDSQQALAHAIHVLRDDPSFATSIALKGAEAKALAAINKVEGKQ